MNEKLIKQLREGTISVENDGTLDDLIKILQYAFPNDKCKIFGDCKYYSKLDYTESIWVGKNRIDLPTYSVKELLTQETETMNTIVNINPDTSENEYPKVMKVSNKPIETLKDFENANTRVVFMEKCGKFIAWLHVNTIEKSENITVASYWNYAVDLDWQPEEEKKTT